MLSYVEESNIWVSLVKHVACEETVYFEVTVLT